MGMKYLRSRIAVLAVFVPAVVTLWPLTARALQGHRIELSAQGSTPLATVSADLEKRFGWVITYEDPVYEHSSDVEQVTNLSRRSNDSSGRPILSPRPGAFAVDIELAPGRTTPANPLECVRRIVEAYNVSGNPGRFRVAQTDGMLHVLPIASNGVDGQIIRRRSILETPISITPGPHNAAAFLKEVVTAVESSNGVKIAIMSAPANLFATAMVQPDVTSGLALNMLARELHQLDASLSWRLMYSPTDHNYMLTIYRVRQDERK